MTPFFHVDWRLLAEVPYLTFHRLKIVPWSRREMARTLAGLKTGMPSSVSAEELAGAARTSVDARARLR
jgi:hypothetical protein